MEKFKNIFNSNSEANDTDDVGLISGINDNITLGCGTRVKLFAIFLVIGFVFSILGSIFLWLPHQLILFAVFYTLGNIMSLASTCFLMGPFKQIQKMFEKKRWIWTTLVLVFMVLTLLSALLWHKKGLCLLFCIFQFLALIWYSLSYIPFAHDLIIRTVTSCLN